MTPARPAPLEATDPQRADALKRKVFDRIKDVRRHLVALQAAMAGFGEDFDLDVFQAEFDSEEPDELNRVKAVERGIDQLYNYMAELAAFGLELAGARRRFDDTNARQDRPLAREQDRTAAYPKRWRRTRRGRRALSDTATAR
ncbi:MAG TPA: hypothetical protein VKB25_07470 [Conexibacter sp.]|nr:hypothetical protein [Conexibacter sp.]